MSKRPLIVMIVVLASLAAGAYGLWAARTAAKLGAGWAGLDTAWPYLLAGVLTVAVAIAAFLRLAFWSQSRGYDDRADTQANKPPQPPRT